MENRLVANRPSTGRLLPPLVTVSGPTATTGSQLQQGRSFDKTLRDIGQEQTYSRRILDNEKQQIKARYERLKKKASQIRSNLTPEQIAELKGMEKAAGGGTSGEAGHKLELQNHKERLAAKRSQRISLELTTAQTSFSSSATTTSPAVSHAPRPKSSRVESAIVAPSAVSMGQKRVRKSATSAKPDFKTREDSTPKPNGARKRTLNKKKSAEKVKKLDFSTTTSWSVSHPIPTPHSTMMDDMSKLKEEEIKRNRSATFVCGHSTTSGTSSEKEEPSIADILNRPRASSAMGRLQTAPENSPTTLPTVPEEVHKVYSPVIMRKSATPHPPTRPKASMCAPLSTHISSEHRPATGGTSAHRFNRKVPNVSPSPPSARPTFRRKSSITNAPSSLGSATVVRAPVSVSVEPPAAFSCHEPKLEDVLSRSSAALNPVAIRRISTAVSPFHESRAIKREELREARIDDNELLAIELEQRKEKLMKGLQDIARRPQEDENEEALQSKLEEVSTSSLKLKLEKQADSNQKPKEDENLSSKWRKEMMKIRYLRLPKDCEEVITSDMLNLATAQHKAVSNVRKLNSK